MSVYMRAYRLLIPLCFLGYAAYYSASIALPLQSSLRLWALEGKSWTDGTATRTVDDLFLRLAPYQSLAIDLAGAIRYQLYGELKPGAVRGWDGYLFAEADIFPIDVVPDRIDYAIGEIKRVSDILKGRGVDLIFVPLPTKMDIERDHHPFHLAAAAGEEAFRRLVSGTVSEGITTVDARKAWISGVKAGNLTHKTDQHWTVYGASLAAAAVADVPGLRKTRNPVIQLVPSVETLAFQGDLASFIGHESVSAQLGYPVEVIRPLSPVYSDSADAAPADFTLIGTSESADMRWSFAASLESSLQGRVENKAMSGMGPLYPMWQVIRNMDEKRPSTVIWEFPVGAIFKDSEFYAENALP